MKSIMQNSKVCYKCNSTKNLHLHHIFFGKNRKKSDKYGIMVYLCWKHHLGNDGVHFNREFDLYLKEIGQKTWQEYYGKTKDDFIKEFGRNYL